MSTQPADGEVLHRARRLYAVVNVAGNVFGAERVLFGAGGLTCLGWHAAPLQIEMILRGGGFRPVTCFPPCRLATRAVHSRPLGTSDQSSLSLRGNRFQSQ